MICTSCSTEFATKCCPECGQPAVLKRIDGHYIVHEISHVLHFERGILYTIRGLLTHPGNSVKQYLTQNRSRLVKPVLFIIVTSLLYSIGNQVFHFEEDYTQNSQLKQSAMSSIFQWIQGHYGYANIIVGVFIAAWTRLLFGKYGYNFFEILILLCFVMGISMLIYLVFGLLQTILGNNLLWLSGLVAMLYISWAVGLFFEHKWVNYAKALSAYLLGSVSFILAIVFLGLAIDIITKL